MNTQHNCNETSKLVEDLTLKEIDATQVKGGIGRPTNSFSFGVEREMKESG